MKREKDFVKLVSLAWDKAVVSFCLNACAFIEIRCAGGGKSFVSKTGEAGNIGRIPINGLCPDTDYKITAKWNNNKATLDFKTLPRPSGKMRSSFAVIADPHVSEKKENRKGRLFAEAGLILEGIIEECNNAKVDFILIAGDLTNNGTKREYDETKRILAKSKSPVCVVPGDHDLAHDGTRRWRAFFGARQWIKDIKEYRIAGVNTGRRILDAEACGLINKMQGSRRFSIILTHVHLLPNAEIRHGAKCRPVNNYDAVKEHIRNVLLAPSIIYAGHQNIPARVTDGKAVQINLPQPSQYLCGYYLVKHFKNGLYHMFMPICSEVLRQYSRQASDFAADFYNEKQWAGDYREGTGISASNFIVPG